MQSPETPAPVSAVRDDALGADDAVALAARIRRGELSAREAVEAAIARLQAVDPVLQAVACACFDLARAAADAGSDGPLAGVPSLIKDNTDLAGLPTRHGSRATPSAPAPADAEFSRQFKGTGLIPLAKTRLPEFGLTATTEFSREAPARNPWHPAYSTGGSSGGSAALVAAGVVPIAHANDGGGSIRIPAACCGLVGLKPTRGRLAHPAMAQSLPLNIVVEGVVSRSVRDTAAFLHAAETLRPNPSLPPLGEVQHPGRQRLRIALITRRPDGGPVHAENLAAAERVAAQLEALGHRVEPVASPFSAQMGDDFLLYWAMLAASLVHFGRRVVGPDFDARRLEPLTLGLARYFRRRLFRFPLALRRLKRYAAEYAAQFEHVDLLMSPTLGHPPPPIGFLALDLPFADAEARLRQYAVFTPPQNVSGAPGISLPLARSATGLPIGIHFAAPFGGERRLLELALELEQAMPWPRHAGGAAPA